MDNDRLSNLEDDFQPDGEPDVLITIVQDKYERDENDELRLVHREPTSYDESGEWRDIGDGRRMRVRYARY